MQDDRLREDAKQLLVVADQRRLVDGVRGTEVDLPAAAEHRGIDRAGPQLAALVDYMEVAGWIEPDPAADPLGRGELGAPIRRITERGMEVVREAIA